MTDKLADRGLTFLHGDCLDVMRGMEPCSVDAIVTDPPYGLSKHRLSDTTDCLRAWLAGEVYAPSKGGFMGKAWDAWVPGPEVWREALRVLKPGGHVLAFAGTRSMDLMSMSIRLAGFEIRDTLTWLYGTGMAKSHNVSKAIDKAAGAEREVVGPNPNAVGRTTNRTGGQLLGGHKQDRGSVDAITAPATDEAKEWDGWGTALSPSYEPIIMARKPLEGTVVENVLEHGTGAINVDAARIEGPVGGNWSGSVGTGAGLGVPDGHGVFGKGMGGVVAPPHPKGRWPANVILDEEAGAMLDAQTGVLSPGHSPSARGPGGIACNGHGGQSGLRESHAEVGGTSRFFYCAKPSRSEKSAGLAGSERNEHVTVKPLALMRWLVRLVTPRTGTVLDPFAGSGTTLIAAHEEGVKAIGIELGDAEHEQGLRRVIGATSQASLL